MSVRSGILAILTLGPAYGLQLHTEFLARAAHRERVNVGQIYGTLDRLATQGLIERAGLTDDALPLYRLTGPGAAEASDWLHGREPVDRDWTEMLDRVLLSCSLVTADPVAVVDAYLENWSTSAAPPDPADPAAFAAAAANHLAHAARRWLASISDAAQHGTLLRGMSEERPRRGRRPAPLV
ncbi:MAG: hypothetical protein JWR33_1260 [Naasia sp.]|jgi:DNA-binding PadR family transcriptional regulator|uniref:PadR family transcriptional regulator n=1 Tax=Naasia sp. TaxID=2546198 RepID=UPI0026226792|nr:PadR family transcriptional regulator [Naasia sp.]MCU1570519.1 hypothetical protein [Naasia sp.]